MASPENLLERFGSNLKQARRNAGLSREALADAALLPRTYVGAVEVGQQNLSVLSIVKLARVLRVPLGDLMAGL